MLRIFDPTILPITRFPFFCFRAENEVASSGRLVPIATIVKPTIVSDIPIKDANCDPKFTVSSDPNNKSIKLKTENKDKEKILFEIVLANSS